MKNTLIYTYNFLFSQHPLPSGITFAFITTEGNVKQLADIKLRAAVVARDKRGGGLQKGMDTFDVKVGDL
jgi:hypothetical protein